MTEHVDLLQKLWFSDESHFYLDQHLNKQNHRYWSDAKPNIFIGKSCHAQKVKVWAALSAEGLIGPFFFEDS